MLILISYSKAIKLHKNYILLSNKVVPFERPYSCTSNCSNKAKLKLKHMTLNEFTGTLWMCRRDSESWTQVKN